MLRKNPRSNISTASTTTTINLYLILFYLVMRAEMCNVKKNCSALFLKCYVILYLYLISSFLILAGEI